MCGQVHCGRWLLLDWRVLVWRLWPGPCAAGAAITAVVSMGRHSALHTVRAGVSLAGTWTDSGAGAAVGGSAVGQGLQSAACSYLPNARTC